MIEATFLNRKVDVWTGNGKQSGTLSHVLYDTGTNLASMAVSHLVVRDEYGMPHTIPFDTVETVASFAFTTRGALEISWKRTETT